MPEKFGFDPSQFKAHEELPEEKKVEYKPAEGGGFVKKTAIEDPERAQEEAEKVVLAETKGLSYYPNGGILSIQAEVGGKRKDLWIDRDFREALNASALTPAIRDAIRESMPKHLKVVPSTGSMKLPKKDARTWSGHFRVDQDDINQWAETVERLLQQKKEDKEPKRAKTKEEKARFEKERDAYVGLLTSALDLSRSDLESQGWNKKMEYVEKEKRYNVFSNETTAVLDAFDVKLFEKDGWMIEQSKGIGWRPDLFSFVAPKNKDIPRYEFLDNPFDIRFVIKKAKEGEGEEVSVLYSKTGKSAEQYEKLCRLKIDMDGKAKLFRDYRTPMAEDIERVKNALPGSIEEEEKK